MDDRWIQNMRKRLEDHETDAPDGLWDDILLSMSEREAPKSSRVLPLWKKISAVAAAVALLLSSGFIYIHMTDKPDARPTLAEKSNSDNRKTHTGINDEADAPLPPTTSVEQETEAGVGILYAANMSRRRAVPAAVEPSRQEIVLPVPDSEEKGAAVEPVNEKELPDNEGMNVSPHKPDRTNGSGLSAGRRSAALPHIGKTKNTTTIGLFASNSSHPSSVGDSKDFALMDNAVSSPVLPMFSKLPFQEPVEYNHKRPLKFGLRVGYSLTDRLTLESGLIYDYQYSEAQQGKGPDVGYGHRKLHYIGISLNLRYDLIRIGRFGAYAGIGGEFEKCVKGTLNLKYEGTRSHDKSVDESIMDGRIRAAATANVGINVKLVDNLGFYVECGGAYHFKNNSGIETYYDVHPWSLDVNLGFRYTIGR